MFRRSSKYVCTLAHRASATPVLTAQLDISAEDVFDYIYRNETLRHQHIFVQATGS